jgi:hypothetical protein
MGGRIIFIILKLIFVFQWMLITIAKKRQLQLPTSHLDSVITINGKPLQNQETMKYLGVKIYNFLENLIPILSSMVTYLLQIADCVNDQGHILKLP